MKYIFQVKQTKSKTSWICSRMLIHIPPTNSQAIALKIGKGQLAARSIRYVRYDPYMEPLVLLPIPEKWQYSPPHLWFHPPESVNKRQDRLSSERMTSVLMGVVTSFAAFFATLSEIQYSHGLSGYLDICRVLCCYGKSPKKAIRKVGFLYASKTPKPKRRNITSPRWMK